MSQKGHSNNQNAATSASSSIQNSTAGTSNRTAERVINGHSGVEKPVQNFQKGGSLDRNSATVRDMTTCSKETGLPLSGSATAERGGKQSADDGGSVCSSFNSSDSNYEVLEKQIQTQVCWFYFHVSWLLFQQFGPRNNDGPTFLHIHTFFLLRQKVKQKVISKYNALVKIYLIPFTGIMTIPVGGDGDGSAVIWCHSLRCTFCLPSFAERPNWCITKTTGRAISVSNYLLPCSVCVCMWVYASPPPYIYIYRERERERSLCTEDQRDPVSDARKQNKQQLQHSKTDFSDFSFSPALWILCKFMVCPPACVAWWWLLDRIKLL